MPATALIQRTGAWGLHEPDLASAPFVRIIGQCNAAAPPAPLWNLGFSNLQDGNVQDGNVRDIEGGFCRGWTRVNQRSTANDGEVGANRI